MLLRNTHPRLTLAAALTLGVAVSAYALAPAASGQGTSRAPAQIRTLTFGGVQLGAEFRDVDDADVQRERLTELAGAVVEEVASEGPAADAGFKAGDVVVTFDGERVRSARHLTRLIEETPDGREVPVTVVRAGDRLDLEVAPAQQTPFNLRSYSSVRPLDDSRFSVEIPRAYADLAESRDLFALREVAPSLYFRPRVRLGVSVSDLTDQLGEYFGATDGGALVSEVTADTPASRAGLRAGDVIVSFDGERVRSSAELVRRIVDAEGEVEIQVVRDKQRQTLRADFRE